MAKLNFKKIASNMLKRYHECGSLQMVLDHPDIAPVKRDRVGVYRVAHELIALIPVAQFMDFTNHVLYLKNSNDERNIIVDVLASVVFKTQNTLLMGEVLQTFLRAPNIRHSVLHAWMKSHQHQLTAKECWKHSTGSEAAHCEQNIVGHLKSNWVGYLKPYWTSDIGLHTFLEFVPLMTPTEDTVNMVVQRLMQNTPWLEDKNAYSVMLNTLEEKLSAYPENPMVLASMRRYFLSMPIDDQEKYEIKRNTQMRNFLQEVVSTQTEAPQPKRKM